MNPSAIGPRSVAELREIDRRAIEDLKLPGIVLMENAGRAAAQVALEMLGSNKAEGTVVVLCGGGGNGGDAYVLARHLALAGQRILLLQATARSRGDAVTMREVARRMGLDEIDLSSEEAYREFATQGRGADLLQGRERCTLIVDGLLGTGARPEVRGSVARLLKLSKELLSIASDGGRGAASRGGGPWALALDLPTGLDADSGDCGEEGAFCADRTVTFAAPKLGFSLANRRWTGEVVVGGVGAPLVE